MGRDEEREERERKQREEGKDQGSGILWLRFLFQAVLG